MKRVKVVWKVALKAMRMGCCIFFITEDSGPLSRRGRDREGATAATSLPASPLREEESSALA
jgi:hypothetical protein